MASILPLFLGGCVLSMYIFERNLDSETERSDASKLKVGKLITALFQMRFINASD